MLFKKIVVKDGYRALLFRHGKLSDILAPGCHWFANFTNEISSELYPVGIGRLEHPQARLLAAEHQDLLSEHCHILETSDSQVALVYLGETLQDIILPGEVRLYWRTFADIRAVPIDLRSSFEIPTERVAPIFRILTNSKNLTGSVLITEIEDNHVGLLLVDGRRIRTLTPGRYGFWQVNRVMKIVRVDLRLQNLEVSGQEILTKDKVSLRINLSGSFRVTDAEKMFDTLSNYSEHLYKELQFGLREAVGTKTLDELLADKEAIASAVIAHAKESVVPHGILIERVGVKDIILPGEMRTILNQVVEAEKLAEANVIRRREETAATRSLHNTAKMLEGNPVLLSLKELEALEKVTEKVDKITVVGGLEGLLNQVGKFKISND
jgi:regulator of protease activity HflC (stomatin/prohibitin superfamily)